MADCIVNKYGVREYTIESMRDLPKLFVELLKSGEAELLDDDGNPISDEAKNRIINHIEKLLANRFSNKVDRLKRKLNSCNCEYADNNPVSDEDEDRFIDRYRKYITA